MKIKVLATNQFENTTPERRSFQRGDPAAAALCVWRLSILASLSLSAPPTPTPLESAMKAAIVFALLWCVVFVFRSNIQRRAPPTLDLGLLDFGTLLSDVPFEHPKVVLKHGQGCPGLVTLGFHGKRKLI
jgi:hypothetical protein